MAQFPREIWQMAGMYDPQEEFDRQMQRMQMQAAGLGNRNHAAQKQGVEKQQACEPRKPAHLNPKLLLTGKA